MKKIRNFIQNLIHYYQGKYSLFFPRFCNFKSLKKTFYLQELFLKIQHLDGDIVECGVAYGDGLIAFGTLCKLENIQRKIYGFDSFVGFPQPSIFDESARKPKKGEYGNATLNYVNSVIRNAGAGPVNLIKGYIEETSKNYSGKIALLYIDLDLYEGYKATLHNMYNKVVSGGIIAFDEYDEEKWPGATRAVDEFLQQFENPPLIQKATYINKYYIVKP